MRFTRQRNPEIRVRRERTGRKLDAEHLGAAPHQVQLYHRAVDPRCLVEVAADNRAVAKSLRAMAIDWLGQAEANNWSEDGGVNQEQLDELAALGYVQPSDGGQSRAKRPKKG